MERLLKTCKNYWIAEETNIFKNYKDALAGLIVLVLVPAISVLLVVFTDDYSFWNYTFPLLSISLAELYDTYGRYEGKSPKNQKLVTRIIINMLAIFFSALCMGTENRGLPYIAPILLLLCGLLLTVEIYNRVKKAILISPWFV